VYCHRQLGDNQVIDAIANLEGVAKVWSRAEAARELQLPYDVEGDFAVMAQQGTAIGIRPDAHDISALRGRRLRSHGSAWEAEVPFMISEPLQSDHAERAASGPLKSYEIFDYAINNSGK
jgi:phosphonoacetate hydrolase